MEGLLFLFGLFLALGLFFLTASVLKLPSLSEDDRQWLDDQLMAKMDIPEQERLRYYKAGLADAIELIHYLRT